MATPEMHSVELDPFAPSYDGSLEAVESEENQIVAAETRELSAYSFDSNDKTLVGIGTSGAASSHQLCHFDSSDRTLVGIGPAERAKHAKLAKLASRLQLAELEQVESMPESVPMPHSELPGPYVASEIDGDSPNSENETPDRLPLRKSEPWFLALSVVLVAAAAFALLRGVVPHASPSRLHSAAAVALLPAPNEPHPLDVPVETAAAAAPEAAAIELASTEAPAALLSPTAVDPVAPALATAEKQPAPAPRRATAKPAANERLGALEVTSNPPSGLVLDGRPLGKAPRVVQLPSGPHTVLFIHPERGRMSVTVNVRAGKTTTASADF